MTETTRKPRIALMGEFSAGKSTLSNLLLGTRPLPEKVTATRLSPVWMSYGTEAPYRVDVDGSKEPVELSQLEGIDVEATRVIRLFFEADILQVCDLIDFPGISDPNMSADVWQRMLCEVDAVLWCTHATQAWRQSEAAVWDTIPEAVREKSILLVTRFDKLTTDRDRRRVLARLGKETDGLFGATFPISLTEALAAGDDYEAFDASGGGDFLQHFIPLIDTLAETVGQMEGSLFQSATGDAPEAPAVMETQALDVAENTQQPEQPSEAAEAEMVQPEVRTPLRTFAPEPETSAPAEVAGLDAPVVHVDSAEPVVRIEAEATAVQAIETGSRIMPRRVRATGGGITKRPRRPSSSAQSLADEARAMVRASTPQAAVASTQLRSIFTSEEESDVDPHQDTSEPRGKAASS